MFHELCLHVTFHSEAYDLMCFRHHWREFVPVASRSVFVICRATRCLTAQTPNATVPATSRLTYTTTARIRSPCKREFYTRAFVSFVLGALVQWLR